MDRYLVISSDGHAGLPPERYREYLDPQYRAQFDERIAKEIAAREQHEKNFLLDDFNNKWRADAGEGMEGAWDSTIRSRVLDEDGVAAEVLYPDGITERNAPPFGADIGLRPVAKEAHLQWAGARAHNRWMAEFCQMDPVRRIGLAIIPAFYDIEENL
ncbi:MAG: amidohydrolase, partial [Brevundimonas sp.]|nr:amidohydrolase [Brevundimonas sp.]